MKSRKIYWPEDIDDIDAWRKIWKEHGIYDQYYAMLIEAEKRGLITLDSIIENLEKDIEEDKKMLGIT